jgi:hypothetical protein
LGDEPAQVAQPLLLGNNEKRERALFRRHRRTCARVKEYMMATILIVILVLALLGVIPAWPHSRGWGYGPSGLVGVVLVILVILLLTGRL